jgi:hypothetical protein
MEPAQLSPRVAQKLDCAQMHAVDADEAQTILTNNGLPVSVPVSDFLSKFHGLHFDLANGFLDFDVRKVLEWLEPDQIPFLPKLTGQPLCPIGYGGRMHILIATTGEVVFLHDEWLFYFRVPDIAQALDVALFPGPHPYEIVDLSDEQRPPPYRLTQSP